MKLLVRHLKGTVTRRWNNIVARSVPILRIIHIVWVGDESKRPDNWIESWRRKNPAWTVRVWGNRELTSLEWTNHKHMSQMLNRSEWPGVADMMRWEILHKHGGFAIDADSVCVRPLENWLFEPRIFACWANEIETPGLIANGYVYSHPGNSLVSQIIDDISALPSMSDLAWKMTGPMRITETYRRMRYTELTIYPSHYFMPRHFRGLHYKGSGHIFAQQMWQSTHRYAAIARAAQLQKSKEIEN